MATVEDFKGQAVLQVDFWVSNTSFVVFFVTQQMTSSYSLDVDDLKPGEKAYQIRVTQLVGDPRDSNVIYDTASCEVSVHRALHLTEMVDEEQFYTRGEMLYCQNGLMDVRIWRGSLFPAVHEVLEGPEMEEEPVRLGNIISYTVRVVVSIVTD